MNTSAQPKSAAVTEIERLNFGYSEVAQYDLTKLDLDHRRVQVRDSEHYAPKESVDKFAVQMKVSQFPPIVVTSDDWIVDGNTRKGAADKNKIKFFPAIVLDVPWEGSPEKRQRQIRALAATLNSNGGIQLTRKEARKMAAELVALDWKADQIGRALGITTSGVSQVKMELAAEAKMRRVGINPEQSSIGGATLRALGSKDVQALNDVPFQALVKLASDAALRVTEIKEIVREARATGSDQGAIDYISAKRTEMEDRISEHALTGNSKPPLPIMLRQHLGFITKYDGREDELVETNPANVGTATSNIETAIKVLTTLLVAQRPSEGLVA